MVVFVLLHRLECVLSAHKAQKHGSVKDLLHCWFTQLCWTLLLSVCSCLSMHNVKQICSSCLTQYHILSVNHYLFGSC